MQIFALGNVVNREASQIICSLLKSEGDFLIFFTLTHLEKDIMLSVFPSTAHIEFVDTWWRLSVNTPWRESFDSWLFWLMKVEWKVWVVQVAICNNSSCKMSELCESCKMPHLCCVSLLSHVTRVSCANLETHEGWLNCVNRANSVMWSVKSFESCESFESRYWCDLLSPLSCLSHLSGVICRATWSEELG